MKELFPCPSCGFSQLSAAYGSFEICGFCDWEDDGVQLANPASGGGANKISLAESQERVPELLAKPGAPDIQTRASGWRPLTGTEVLAYKAETQERNTPWPNKAITDPEAAYWNRFSMTFGRPVHGWMRIAVADKNQSFEIDASDVPADSISDLTSALLRLLNSGLKASCTWNLEPVELRFDFTVIDKNVLEFSILEENREQSLVFKSSLELREACRSIGRGLNYLAWLDKNKQYEGEDTWSWPFPSRELEMLNSKLSRQNL